MPAAAIRALATPAKSRARYDAFPLETPGVMNDRRSAMPGAAAIRSFATSAKGAV